MIARVADWLESRTGYRALLHAILEEPVRGGARWAYVFGSVTTFLLLLQAVTGVVLATAYSPSVQTAWASVAEIQDELPLGWLVRGLHSTGASAMIIVVTLHLLQVVLYGAYQAPREVNYLAGVLMLGLVFAFALTGYLLPWDQKGYWATQVATGILGTTPLVGPALQRLVQGGAAYGNYTLTRFYALHTYVLPGAIFLLLGAHLYLFRRHGVTSRWGRSEEELERTREPFSPRQLFRDCAASALSFAAILAVVLSTHGADLEAPADPASTYVARPEWYFLPLFQLLKYFEGPLEIVGTMVIPGIASGLLFALPFLDRGPDRHPRRRRLVLASALGGFAAVIALGLAAVAQDAADPGFKKQRAAERERAERARTLARKGVPPEGGTAVFRNDPLFAAREIWQERCAGCHSLDGEGGEKGPDLKGYNSRAWIRLFLVNPDGPLRMGPAKLVKGMKPVEGTPEELDALAEFVYAQSGAGDVDRARAARGEALFSEKDCDSCHEIDGKTEGDGPNLGGRGTLAYTRAIIAHAGAPLYYGKVNKMPRFDGKLDEAQLDAMARFVLAQRESGK